MKQTGINMETVKKQNRASIFNFMNERGPISKKDIAAELGLTAPAVTQICARFIEAGILTKREEPWVFEFEDKLFTTLYYLMRSNLEESLEELYSYILSTNTLIKREDIAMEYYSLSTKGIIVDDEGKKIEEQAFVKNYNKIIGFCCAFCSS